MDQLKLIAMDDEDLKIISAHVQDAVMNVGNIEFWKSARLFVLPMYRFVWEREPALLSSRAERRNSVLNFNRVNSAKAMRIPREQPDEILSLLAITFTPTKAPGGIVELAFSGGGTIRLDVECIEARLSDLGGAWEASSRPVHKT